MHAAIRTFKDIVIRLVSSGVRGLDLGLTRSEGLETAKCKVKFHCVYASSGTTFPECIGILQMMSDKRLPVFGRALAFHRKMPCRRNSTQVFIPICSPMEKCKTRQIHCR